MDEAFAVLKKDVDTCLALEARMRGTRTAPTKGKKMDKRAPAVALKTVQEVLEASVSACGKKRKRMAEEAGPGESKEGAALSQYTRFTDAMALDPYKLFLHYVPRLVNVVTVRLHCTPLGITPPPPSPPFHRPSPPPQLAEALPVPGSGLSLPLNLQEIAAKCTGAFYAPRRFAVRSTVCNSVPCSLCHPRRFFSGRPARLLAPSVPCLDFSCAAAAATPSHSASSFHIVPVQIPVVWWAQVRRLQPLALSRKLKTTRKSRKCARAGTNGAMAARLAIARAQRQLGVEAGVHLNIRNFSVRSVCVSTRPLFPVHPLLPFAQVINQVGAASLRATLNCDAFARAHSANSHFDRSSFVGLAWRPPKESICCGTSISFQPRDIQSPPFHTPPLALRNLFHGTRQVCVPHHVSMNSVY